MAGRCRKRGTQRRSSWVATQSEIITKKIQSGITLKLLTNCRQREMKFSWQIWSEKVGSVFLTVQHLVKIYRPISRLCLAVLSLSLTLLKWSNFGREDNQISIKAIDSTSDAMMDFWSASQMMAFLESSQMTNRSSCIIYSTSLVALSSTILTYTKTGRKSVCLDSSRSSTIV